MYSFSVSAAPLFYTSVQSSAFNSLFPFFCHPSTGKYAKFLNSLRFIAKIPPPTCFSFSPCSRRIFHRLSQQFLIFVLLLVSVASCDFTDRYPEFYVSSRSPDSPRPLLPLSLQMPYVLLRDWIGALLLFRRSFFSLFSFFPECLFQSTALPLSSHLPVFFVESFCLCCLFSLFPKII